jgi:hypothetical protein
VDKCSIPTKVILMENSTRGVPALAVVITTWNRGNMVLDAIDSALSQDCPELLEVIVVDDGSTDSTPAVLQGLSVRTLHQNRLLQIVRTDRHGRAGSAQRGIDAASAPYVALLSSDDLWEPRRASELIDEERRLGGNALVYTGWKTRPAVCADSSAGAVTVPRTRSPYRGWAQEPCVLRRYVTSILSRNPFPYPICSAVFPRSMLQGVFRLPDGLPGPDHWSAIAGYLQCTVAILSVTSLVRRTHDGQQHILADANMWPGLAEEQESGADAIVRLLAEVVPDERSMIEAMRARKRLMALRRSCLSGQRLRCLAGSIGMARAGLKYPGLWPAIASNVFLAAFPRLHSSLRYGRARSRLARSASC